MVNIGNQTKLFSTAVFCYLILGQSRTTRQVLALILICFGCTLGCLDEGSLHSVLDSPSAAKASNFLGLMSLGAASMLSGYPEDFMACFFARSRLRASYVGPTRSRKWVALVAFSCLYVRTWSAFGLHANSLERNGSAANVCKYFFLL